MTPTEEEYCGYGSTVMRLGHHRLWSPETLNEIIGIDDRYVAARGHQSLFVWDHHTGDLVEGIDARSITHGTGPIEVDVGDRYHVKTSLDGRWVAAATYGGRVRVYDRGVMKFPEDPEHGYRTVRFSPDGTRIVGTADGAYIWTLGEDMPRRVASCARTAQLDASGDLVGGADQGMMGRWSVDGRELARISVRGNVEWVSISADGRYGAATSYGTSGLCAWPLPDVVVADFARGRAVMRFR